MKFYNEICDKLRNKEYFKFSRWGDGEWGCMFGWEGKNRDGNEYLPELKEELTRIMYSRPDYYMGLQYGVLYNDDLRNFVFEHLFSLDVNWVNGDVLHQASEFGHMGQFVEALKGRNVTIIGAKYFEELPYKHIVTTEANSYSQNTVIIQNALQEHDNPVYLVASAMNSNVIIDQLPNGTTCIDIGSVFDPYLGRPRASYQHKLKTEWLW